MKTISLNGSWRADYVSNTQYTEVREPCIKKSSNLTLPVPGYWEDMTDILEKSALSEKISYNPLYTIQRYPQTGYVNDMALKNPVGCFVYQRTFELDRVCGDAALWFGGIQNRASAWINGKYIGEHEGYSSSFSFDIPDGILKNGENTVTLAVSNTRLSGYMKRPISGLTSRAANECTGGIYGDVELRFYEDTLRDVWVSTANDLSHFTVRCIGGENIEKTVRIYDGDAEIFNADIKSADDSISIPTDGFEFWSPDTPKLYTLSLETQNQRLTRRFGIRRLSVSGTKLLLNGEPYYFLGTCEHCYHPITVHPTRDKNYYINVIKTLKSLGFNSIRFHTYVPPVEYMEAADEVGILIEVETPNNTTYAEWVDIVKMVRRYTSPMIYSSGNEMVIDEDYIEHLRKCANLVHTESDSLFSPMSAMRGIEYHSYGDTMVDVPFPHNPQRLAKLSEFADLYNTYSLGLVSYESDKGDHRLLDKRNAIYKKPLLTHEICIGGTYTDLSLKERYKGSRIGKTEIFTSVEEHLEDKGLLDRAEIYYKNSVRWQSVLRKNCFETVRLSESFAGYDFLGDIDTHWHTFGYCVGMMNEFYEMKPGETKENVLKYNSKTVILADLPKSRNFTSSEQITIPIFISNYSKEIKASVLSVKITSGSKEYLNDYINLSDIPSGELSRVYDLTFKMPAVTTPTKLTLAVTLYGNDAIFDNDWDMYVYPETYQNATKSSILTSNIYITSDISAYELLDRLGRGEGIVLFGNGPFSAVPTSFQISLAGRTTGHLATVISDHPLTREIPNDGFCSMQYREMMNGSQAIILDNSDIPYAPIIEIATSYKNARREALMAEYRIGDGRLLIVGLNLDEQNPAAAWLKKRIITYAQSDEFDPAIKLTKEELSSLFATSDIVVESNENAALNKNDITMQ